MGLIFKIGNFEARVTELSPHVLGIKIKLFAENENLNILPPLRWWGLKCNRDNFKKVNYEARFTNLSKNVLLINIRLVCQIGRIILPGASRWSKFNRDNLLLKLGNLKCSLVDT